MATDCSYKYLMNSFEYFKPCDKDPRPYYLVTVSVDRVDFVNKLDVKRDMKMSSYILLAKGSTLMVKIDVMQRVDQDSKWEQVGDALMVFVSRDTATHRAFNVP